MQPDFRVIDSGVSWTLMPQTEAAEAWAAKHLPGNDQDEPANVYVLELQTSRI